MIPWGSIQPIKNETISNTKRLTDKAMRMVKNLTVRFELLRSLINVNMPAARLAMTRNNRITIMIFISMGITSGFNVEHLQLLGE